MLTISYSANEGTMTRTAMITLSTRGFGSISKTLSLTQAATHAVAVSTMTEGVTIGEEYRDTIPISLSAASTTAAFTIDLEGGATGWTATEASDPTSFLSDVTASGSDPRLTYY